MADNTHLLLRSNLKQLKLPTMTAEFEKLAREAGAANEAYEQYLLRLTELEVAARSTNAVQTRIRNAAFPVLKDFDTFDFSAVPSLNKPKVLELARGEWISERSNACLIGAPGTGKPQPPQYTSGYRDMRRGNPGYRSYSFSLRPNVETGGFGEFAWAGSSLPG
jgi:DNA replication protein DnaC